MRLSTTLGKLRLSFGRLVRGDRSPDCCCGCKETGDCPAPDGHFAVCCNGTCKNTRDDTGECIRPDGSTFQSTYDECGRDDQSNTFLLCPCNDRTLNKVEPDGDDWCKQCQDSGGTCCPDGCCPEPNWVCCKDQTTFCAATSCDCPPEGSPPPLPYGPGTELKRLLYRVGIRPTSKCKCNARAAEMDRMEAADPGWCERNIDTIVGWLREEAEKRRLPFVDAVGRMIVRRAIARYRRMAE